MSNKKNKPGNPPERGSKKRTIPESPDSQVDKAKKGKKGEKGLSREEQVLRFLCTELVIWLTNQGSFLAGHCLENLDALVKSPTITHPAISDIEDRYIKPGKASVGVPFQYLSNKQQLPKGGKQAEYLVCLSSSIPVQMLRQEGFASLGGQTFSAGHYEFLNLIIRAVDKQFKIFMDILNRGLQNQNASEDEESDKLQRSKKNLEVILKLLKKKNKGYSGILIPDLFESSPTSLLTTCNLRRFQDTTAKEQSGALYTYMYSCETSQAFSLVLAEKLEEKLERIEAELNIESATAISAMRQMSIEQWLSAMPKAATKEKMNIALRMLGVRNEGPKEESKIGWTLGELIFVYRALEKSRVIGPKVKKSNIAVALEILTGKSHLKYMERYVHATEPLPDLNQFLGLKPGEIANQKRSLSKLVHDLNKALEEQLKDVGIGR